MASTGWVASTLFSVSTVKKKRTATMRTGIDGVEDLDGDVLVELPGHLVGPPPVAQDGVQDQQEDDRPPTMMPVVIIPE